MPFGKGNSFPPACRLHCRNEFDRVWKGGRKRHAAHFLVIIMQRPCGPTRLGLTVSRKIGGAVARNRVKRLLREFFRLSCDRLPSSADLVIVAKKGAAELTYEEVATELQFLKAEHTIPSAPCSKKSP